LNTLTIAGINATIDTYAKKGRAYPKKTKKKKYEEM
jgi:hypothetical protein